MALQGGSMLVPRWKMRSLLVSVLLLLFAAAAHGQGTPEAVVASFMDGFSAGDMAKSAAMNSAAGTSIIDEFAPYSWSGVKAFDDWGAAFEANSKALGITAPKVTLDAPIVKNMTDGRAYLIYPALYTYQQKGVAMREAGRIAIALRKEASAWKIAAWTWTGTVPEAAH